MSGMERRSEEEGIIHQQEEADEENESFLIKKQDEDEEINGGGRRKNTRKMSKKAKLATFFSPFTKVKKLSSNNTNLNSSSTNPFPSGGKNKSITTDTTNIEINSCYMCCGYVKEKKKKKKTGLGFSPISSPSDPNSLNFSYESCKALIENNDFFSKQCNVHLDII